jgi:hypothetical protein
MWWQNNTKTKYSINQASDKILPIVRTCSSVCACLRTPTCAIWQPSMIAQGILQTNCSMLEFRIWWQMLLGGVRSEESIWLSKNSYRTSTEEVKIDGRKPPSEEWLLVFTNYPGSPMTLSSSSNLILTGCHVLHAMVYFKELDTLNMFNTPPITLELLHHLHSNCICPLSTLNIWKGKLKRLTSLINSRLV